MKLTPTPSQTVGPFLHIGLPYAGGSELVAADDPDAVRLWGLVLDANGEPVDDALIEIWQANRAGRYAHPEDTREEIPLEPGFDGFGRCPTDGAGRYEFLTVKPGAVPGPNGGMQAPHIDVSVFARGLLKRLVTRIYFPDEAEANGADPVLVSIEDPAARETLVARPEEPGAASSAPRPAAATALRFDIRLQGDGQTAFFVV